MYAICNCLSLCLHCVSFAARETLLTDGINNASRMAITAMTTKSSTKVKPAKRKQDNRARHPVPAEAGIGVG